MFRYYKSLNQPFNQLTYTWLKLFLSNILKQTFEPFKKPNTLKYKYEEKDTYGWLMTEELKDCLHRGS